MMAENPSKEADRMNSVCVVIGAAPDELEWEDLERALARRTTRKPYICCADGGIRHARRLGLYPDMLIGDMDSAGDGLNGGGGERAAAAVVRLPREKDQTDLFACVEDGLKKGFRDFVLICCTNGRIDHFMAAAALLEYLDENDATGILLDRWNEITFLKPGRIRIERDSRFGYLSIVPLDPVLSGITLKGVRYPLDNATVRRPDMCLLISNEIVQEEATIETASGSALLIRSRDADRRDDGED